MGAQHLTACHAADYSIQGLRHRVAAIAELNRALSAPQVTAVDGDARFAAAIALTFQSTYMTDGMMEFFSMMRGWMIIQTSVVPSFQDSAFREFTEMAYVDSMRGVLPTCAGGGGKAANDNLVQHLVDLEASLHILAPLCRSDASTSTYLSLMEQIACLAKESPADGRCFHPPLSLSH